MDSSSVVALLLLLAAATCSAKSIPSFAGPYIAYVQRFVGCDANDTVWREMYGSLKMSTFNPARPYDLQTMTGSYNLKVDVDDTYQISVVVHKRANNQWKKNYFIFHNIPMGFCSTLRINMPDPFRVLFKPKSMSGRCVIAKKVYTVDHEAVPWRFPNLPTLPYGSYFNQMTGRRQNNHSDFVQICAEIMIIPKP